MHKWACVARLGSIGDNLIASSVLPLLKKQGYMVEVLTQEGSHVVFENNPNIDKLTVKRKEDLPGSNVEWQAYFQNRAREYDRFHALSYSLESHVAFHPDSAPFIWPDSYRRAMANKSYLGLTHDICELPHEFAPKFFPTEEEKAKAVETKAKIGEKCVGWCISGSRIDKVHPFSAMAIGRIIKEIGLPVVMMGGDKKDFEYARTVEEHVERQNGSKGGLFLAMKDDEWPLRRSLSFLQACDLVIGPDTGPMWAVASEPMPKIMLLGHASPFNITYGWKNTTTLFADQGRVPCYPCHKLHADASTCRPNKDGLAAACISDISVEDIVMAAKRALDD